MCIFSKFVSIISFFLSQRWLQPRIRSSFCCRPRRSTWWFPFGFSFIPFKRNAKEGCDKFIITLFRSSVNIVKNISIHISIPSVFFRLFPYRIDPPQLARHCFDRCRIRIAESKRLASAMIPVYASGGGHLLVCPLRRLQTKMHYRRG